MQPNKTKLTNLINNYSEFSMQLEGSVEAFRSEPDKGYARDILDMFYTEGWEYNYSDDGSFYTLGDRNKEIEKLLEKYGEEAPELKSKYEEIKLKVWQLLPDFYHYHVPSFRYYEPPANYNTDKPFEV